MCSYLACVPSNLNEKNIHRGEAQMLIHTSIGMKPVVLMITRSHIYTLGSGLTFLGLILLEKSHAAHGGGKFSCVSLQSYTYINPTVS